MIKRLINGMRYCFYSMSAAKKLFFIVYMIFFGCVLYNRGLESIHEDCIFLIWIPAVLTNGQEKMPDIYKMLPMSDWNVRAFSVLRDVVFAVSISIVISLAGIPYAIKEGSPIVLIKLIIIMSFFYFWFNECQFKYKEKKYPGIILRLFALIMASCIGFFITQNHTIVVDFIICILFGAGFTGYLGIVLFLIRNIPINEMSVEKR